MECNFYTCTRHAESNGMCVFHQIYASGTTMIKKEQPLKKETDHIKSVKAQLKKLYPVFLAQRTVCQIQSPNCTKVSTCVHHIKGRGKNEVLDQGTWVASCETCNLWCETNHGEAAKAGFKVSRHQKGNESITVGASNVPHLCGITPFPDPQPQSGQELIVDYSKTRAAINSLLKRVKDNPDKYYYISDTEFKKKGVLVEKVAPMYKVFLQITNCSLPADFIEYLT